MIEIGEKLKCQDCGREFRWIPNSTIYPKRCRMCENRRLLERSSFARNNKKDDRTSKYTSPGKKPAKRGKTDKQRARDRADEWFSRYIRIRYGQILPDGTVICRCFITGKIMDARRIDNGHCFSRKFLLTRYEEDNCRPQNRSSNRFSGEADHYKFRDKLLSEIGEERFSRLDQLRQQEGSDTEQFYREQADKYRVLTNQIVKSKNIKKWW